MNLWPALSKKEWSILILMGLTGTTICSISQYEGLRYAPVFHCVLFSAAVPAITAFLARIFLKDQLSLLQWGGILLSFFGVIFMLTKGNIGNIWYESLNIGDLLFFINEVSWSVYIIASRYVLKNLPPLQVTALASFTGIGHFYSLHLKHRKFKLDSTEYDICAFIYICCYFRRCFSHAGME